MSATVLKTVKCGRNISAAVFRQKHTLTAGESRLGAEAVGTQQQQRHQQMHQVVAQSGAAPLPPPHIFMPPNVKELEASEKAQFSPRRTRDTSSARLAALGSLYSSGMMKSEGVRESSYNFDSVPVDCHIGVYDGSNTVSLDSSIQTNVPKPFGLSAQAPSHFHAPDCHGEQDDKYVAGDLQDHHQSTHISSKKTSGTALCHFGSSGAKWGMRGVTVLPSVVGHTIRHYGSLCYSGRLVVAGMPPTPNYPNLVRYWLFNSISNSGCVCGREVVKQERRIHNCMTDRVQEKKDGEGVDSETPHVQLTARQKLQRAVKEYGSTVIVFHVAISLTSLGICYLLVSSGVDMTGLIKALGINLGTASDGVVDSSIDSTAPDVMGPPQAEGESDANTRRAAGAATFVVAYAVHKVFAPARIGITLTATPFIVRYLRRIGFLKPPKPKTV